MLSLTNAERVKHGCGPLAWQGTLARVARAHSQDMAQRGFFDHTNPDGTGPSGRVSAAGYQWTAVAENIAAGQPTPAEVTTGWMNSPGHRKNILNCAYTELGVGVHKAPGTKFGIYWTQNFGKR